MNPRGYALSPSTNSTLVSNVTWIPVDMHKVPLLISGMASGGWGLPSWHFPIYGVKPYKHATPLYEGTPTATFNISLHKHEITRDSTISNVH